MTSNTLARVVPTVRTNSTLEINRVIGQLAGMIFNLQGKGGPATIEGDLTIPSLHIGEAAISDDLLADAGGFTSRPVAPFIPGSKNLTDAVVAQLFQVELVRPYFNSHGMIFYEIDAFGTGNRAQCETGFLTYSGTMSDSGQASGVSAVSPASQALTSGSLVTTFSTVNSTDFYTVQVSCNTSLPSTTILRIRYWVWPAHGDITLL